MPLKKSRKISSKIKSTNPWWTYKIDRYTYPSGKEGEYHYVHTPGSVYIIPVLNSGRILLVNQYRYLNDMLSLEFPGGGIKEGEEADEAAHKELIEETGYDGKLEKIGFFNPFSGVTDELCYVFIARNLNPSSDRIKDESEEFELVELSVEEIEEKIRSNEIFSGMTMASWALVKNKI
jgi:ADP-ribose pyrophosphatase